MHIYRIKYDSVWYSILQKTKDNNFILRSFKANKIYRENSKKGNYKIITKEIYRTFICDNYIRYFEKYYVKNLSYTVWYYDIEKYNCGNSVLYEKNIRQLIKGTYISIQHWNIWCVTFTINHFSIGIISLSIKVINTGNI